VVIKEYVKAGKKRKEEPFSESTKIILSDQIILSSHSVSPN